MAGKKVYIHENRFFERVSFIVLLFQIVSTALYFNGYFTNPLVNKALLGQYTGLTAWLFYGIHCFVNRRFVLAWSPYYLPAACFTVWAGIRSVTAESALATHAFYVFFCILLSFPLWVTFFRNKQYRLFFMGIVFFAGTCMLIGSLRQLLMATPRFDWPFFTAITLSTGDYERQRLGAFLGHNNACAEYILIGTLSAAYLWYLLRNKIWSYAFGIVVVLGFIMIYLSGSRGTALSLLAAYGLILYALFHKSSRWQENPLVQFYRNNKRSLLIGGSVIAVSLFIFVLAALKSPSLENRGSNLMHRFLTPSEELISGTYPRVWWFSLLMVYEHPFVGVGFSSWPHQYPYIQEKWFSHHPKTRLGLPRMNNSFPHSQDAHNDYLQAWAELGLPGLICVLWLLFVHWQSIRQLLGSNPIPVLGLFAAAATVAELTRNLVAFPFHEAAASCVFLGNLALVSSLVSQKNYVWQPRWLADSHPQNLGFAIGGSVLLYLVCSYPVYNYIAGDFAIRDFALSYDKANVALQAGNKNLYNQYIAKGRENYRAGINRIPFVGEHLYNYATDLLNQAEPSATNVVHPGKKLSPNLKFDKEKALLAVNYLLQSLGSYVYFGSYEQLGRAYGMLWENTLDDTYYQKAVENYQKAVGILPIYEDGWCQLALLKAKKGEDYSAIWHTEARYPGFTEKTLLPLAVNTANPDTASLLFQIAATANPESGEVFKNAVAFFYRINRLDLVENAIIGYADIQPVSVIKPAINQLLYERLNRKQVAEAYNLVLTLRKKEKLPKEPDFWFYSGIVAWIANQPWDTIHCWMQAHNLGVPIDDLNPSFKQIFTFVAGYTFSL